MGNARIANTRTHSRVRAFSLIELVIVIVIIGILASTAIPRLSRGAAGARSAALDTDLAVVRRAIYRYAIEHQNAYPGPSAAEFANQLVMYSGKSGAVRAGRDATHIFGPYLVQIPPAPTGPNEGNNGVLIDAANSPPKADTGRPEGWVYNPNTGEFYLNDSTIAQMGAGVVTGGGAIVLDAK